MNIYSNSPADQLISLTLNHRAYLDKDALLHLISASGLLAAIAAEAQFGKASYADMLAYQALREIETEIVEWKRESRRDPNGDFWPWPFAESAGVRKLDLAREFFIAAMEADNRQLSLEYDAHHQSHWIVYPFEHGNSTFSEQVQVRPGGDIRRSAGEACDRVHARICARNRKEFERVEAYLDEDELA